MTRTSVIILIIWAAYCNGAITRSLNDIRAFEEYLRSTVNGKPIKSVIPGLDELQNVEETSGKFEGDIVLTEDQITEMVDQYAGRNGVIDTKKQWFNGIVYYEIASSHFTSAQINAIEAAIADFNRYTCVNIRKRTPSITNYIFVTGKTDGCYSTVGFWGGGPQTLNLSPNIPGKGCFQHGSIIHEFMHSLGFYHMQSASDRDFWVNIVWDKIQPAQENNFVKYPASVVSHYGQKYDYGSVMHYSEYSFSIDGSRTIVPLKSHAETIGQRVKMTTMDIGRINRMYYCP